MSTTDLRAATAETGVPPIVVEGLNVRFARKRSLAHVVSDVSFSVPRGKTLALVGESGSDKTMTSMALMGLIDPRQGGHVTGSVRVDGEEIVGASAKTLRRIRASKIAMVFQDPAASLDPAFTVGHQIVETIVSHSPIGRAAATDKAQRLLARVGIPSPRERLRSYPHELSGGMRQRVMIALALSCDPKVLIADEATTALDVTVQAQVLELLKSLQAEFGMSLIFITHDLGVVADIADEVAVMYAGEIIEQGNVFELFARPGHPYMEALLAATPHRLAAEGWGEAAARTAAPVAGHGGCRFAARCPYVRDICRDGPVPLASHLGRLVRCHFAEELHLRGTAQPQPEAVT